MHHLDEERTAKPQGPHVDAQQHYYEMRRRADVAKRVYSEAYAQQKAAEEKLVEILMDMGISRLDYMDDGSKLHIRPGVRASVTKQNEEVVRDFLRRKYGDDEIFSKAALDKAAILEQLSGDLESGKLSETEVPNEMNLQRYPAVYITGWKKP